LFIQVYSKGRENQWSSVTGIISTAITTSVSIYCVKESVYTKSGGEELSSINVWISLVKHDYCMIVFIQLHV